MEPLAKTELDAPDTRRALAFAALNLLIVLAAIAIAAGAAILIPYLWQFDGSAPARRQSMWAEFGTYAGALLGPVLGILALFGVLYLIRLQRDVLALSRAQLAEVARSERNARLLAERNGFETGFFRLLETVDGNASRVAIVLTSRSAQRALTGSDAFSNLIRGFDAKYMRPFDRGDLLEQPRGVYLRNAAKNFFFEVENQIGPYFRSLGDIFQYIKDYETRIIATAPLDKQSKIWTGPILRHPNFYARVVANSRTRHEMKLFAMYVASGTYIPIEKHAPPLRTIASSYDIFATSIDPGWWGRSAFIDMI
ncbi:MAG: hypothetical protein ABI900_07430 [Betaproteobacteria bacterium]